MNPRRGAIRQRLTFLCCLAWAFSAPGWAAPTPIPAELQVNGVDQEPVLSFRSGDEHIWLPVAVVEKSLDIRLDADRGEIVTPIGEVRATTVSVRVMGGESYVDLAWLASVLPIRFRFDPKTATLSIRHPWAKAAPGPHKPAKAPTATATSYRPQKLAFAVVRGGARQMRPAGRITAGGGLGGGIWLADLGGAWASAGGLSLDGGTLFWQRNWDRWILRTGLQPSETGIAAGGYYLGIRVFHDNRGGLFSQLDQPVYLDSPRFLLAGRGRALHRVIEGDDGFHGGRVEVWLDGRSAAWTLVGLDRRYRLDVPLAPGGFHRVLIRHFPAFADAPAREETVYWQSPGMLLAPGQLQWDTGFGLRQAAVGLGWTGPAAQLSLRYGLHPRLTGTAAAALTDGLQASLGLDADLGAFGAAALRAGMDDGNPLWRLTYDLARSRYRFHLSSSQSAAGASGRLSFMWRAPRWGVGLAAGAWRTEDQSRLYALPQGYWRYRGWRLSLTATPEGVALAQFATPFFRDVLSAAAAFAWPTQTASLTLTGRWERFFLRGGVSAGNGLLQIGAFGGWRSESLALQAGARLDDTGLHPALSLSWEPYPGLRLRGGYAPAAAGALSGIYAEVTATFAASEDGLSLTGLRQINPGRGSLEVVLADENGRTIDGPFRVHVDHRSPSQYRDGGRVRVGNLKPGEHLVTIDDGELPLDVRLKKRRFWVTIRPMTTTRLKAPARRVYGIVGRIRCAGGTQPPGRRDVFLEGGGQTRQTATNQYGVFRFDSVENGTYRIGVTGTDASPETVTVSGDFVAGVRLDVQCPATGGRLKAAAPPDSRPRKRPRPEPRDRR